MTNTLKVLSIVTVTVAIALLLGWIYLAAHTISGVPGLPCNAPTNSVANCYK